MDEFKVKSASLCSLRLTVSLCIGALAVLVHGPDTGLRVRTVRRQQEHPHAGIAVFPRRPDVIEAAGDLCGPPGGPFVRMYGLLGTTWVTISTTDQTGNGCCPVSCRCRRGSRQRWTVADESQQVRACLVRALTNHRCLSFQKTGVGRPVERGKRGKVFPGPATFGGPAVAQKY